MCLYSQLSVALGRKLEQDNSNILRLKFLSLGVVLDAMERGAIFAFIWKPTQCYTNKNFSQQNIFLKTLISVFEFLEQLLITSVSFLDFFVPSFILISFCMKHMKDFSQKLE